MQFKPNLILNLYIPVWWRLVLIAKEVILVVVVISVEVDDVGGGRTIGRGAAGFTRPMPPAPSA